METLQQKFKDPPQASEVLAEEDPTTGKIASETTRNHPSFLHRN